MPELRSQTFKLETDRSTVWPQGDLRQRLARLAVAPVAVEVSHGGVYAHASVDFLGGRVLT